MESPARSRLSLNRASSVYLCVFVVFAVGIWVIVELGSMYLTAPPDLTGTWRRVGQPAGEQPDAFTISQSGKFVRFAFANNGPRFDVIMNQPANQNNSGKGQPPLTLDGQGWHVEGAGFGVGSNVEFRFKPPTDRPSPHSGTYRRERMGDPNQQLSKSADSPVQLASQNAGK